MRLVLYQYSKLLASTTPTRAGQRSMRFIIRNYGTHSSKDTIMKLKQKPSTSEQFRINNVTCSSPLRFGNQDTISRDLERGMRSEKTLVFLKRWLIRDRTSSPNFTTVMKTIWNLVGDYPRGERFRRPIPTPDTSKSSTGLRLWSSDLAFKQRR